MKQNWTIMQFNGMREADSFVLNHGPIPLPWEQLSTGDGRYYIIFREGCLSLNGHQKSITATGDLRHICHSLYPAAES